MKTYDGNIARRPASTPSKALGRALACLGYGTQLALLEEAHVVDAPAASNQRPATGNQRSGGGGAGERRRPLAKATGEELAEAKTAIGRPADPAADLMPADPALVPGWFKRRVAAMPELEADEATTTAVAKSIAYSLRQTGLSDEVRAALYRVLTGQESGLAMEPRELVLLAQLVSHADVLKTVGEMHLHSAARGRNGRC